ncbi:MAG: alanine racemase, partial [Actinobacteria bacterium]|nr:alanine racemase [Actinomycetota bacterium]
MGNCTGDEEIRAVTRALCVWAEIDLGCISRNVARIKAALEPGAAFLAVVKANGYGHGEVEAATAALEGGADWLGVARVEEGAAVREAGIEAPILLLSDTDREALAEPARDLSDKASGPGVLVLVLVVVVAAPIAEEVFYRGLLQRTLARRWPIWPVMIVTS